MRIINLSDQDVNNLMVFLDRVPIQGHQERGAMNQIVQALSQQIKPDRENRKGEDKDGEKTPGSAPVPAGPA